jgi:putative transposase
MQAVGRRYVRYVNAAHGRTGSLWEGRFKSSLVDTDAYLLSCYRYIELNPVRAHMVESAADYPWSSAGYHIENRRDPLIADHPVFLGIAEDPEARRRYYRHYTELGDLDGHVELIRKAIRASRPFARSAFLAGVERTTGTRFPRDRKGRPHARARTLD